MDETVLVNLKWTYGVQVDGRTLYYGPGRTRVPREVAERRGWEIVEETADVLTEERTDYPTADVTAAAGVEHLTDALLKAGYHWATHINQAETADLTAIAGIGSKTAVKLKAAARKLTL